MAIVGLALISCEMLDTETKYYVKDEVVAVEGTDVSEYHQILVVTAWKKGQATEFFCKDYWCEEFGPFYTGEETYIKVNSPNFIAQLRERGLNEEEIRFCCLEVLGIER